MPGVHIDRRRSVFVGVAVFVVTAVVATGIAGYRAWKPEDGWPVTLVTEQIGDGVAAGTDVRIDGVGVGKVTDIGPAAFGTQRISMRLDPKRLHGLDDSLGIDYAPANLFGISEIELRRGPGGRPLRPGSVIALTGARADGVYDATMGSLLRSMSQVSTTVLTPQLSTLIARLATDMQAFTPFMQAAISLARTVADTQRMDPSVLLENFGRALGPTSELVDATTSVIDRIYTIDVLRNNRPTIDAGLDMVMNKLFPTLTTTLFHTGAALGGYTDMLAPLLSVLGQMVPDPHTSSAQLGQVIERLRTAMPDTGAGPALNLDLDLTGVPGLAVPLLGGAKGGAR
ncbi:MlaD family protein [Nocardia nova]|nr:MlaD family protein [Nocardia nova]